MIKSAIIGGGFIGSSHAAAYENIDGVKVVAIVEANEKVGKELGNKHHIKHYLDAKEMLDNEDVDMIDVCLPTFLHEEYVFLGAKYKKHVLCEKPFTLTVASAKRMVKACEDAGVKFMIAQAARWWPEFVEVKNCIDNDMIGNIHMVSVNRLAQHPTWTQWHRIPEKSGGGLFDLHVHDIDYLYYLFGSVKDVYSLGWKSQCGCWNHMVTSLTFNNGVKAVSESSLEMMGQYPFSIGLRLAGDKSTIEYKFSAGLNIKDKAESSFIYFENGKDPEKLEANQPDAFEAEIQGFVDAIAENTSVMIPPTESVEVLEIIEAIKKSLETGKVISK